MRVTLHDVPQNRPPSALRPPISTIGLGRTSRFLGQARAQAAGQNNHLHGSAAPRGLLIGPTRSLSQLGQATSSTSTQRGPPERDRIGRALRSDGQRNGAGCGRDAGAIGGGVLH